jgi:hypothetical protein
MATITFARGDARRNFRPGYQVSEPGIVARALGFRFLVRMPLVELAGAVAMALLCSIA